MWIEWYMIMMCVCLCVHVTRNLYAVKQNILLLIANFTLLAFFLGFAHIFILSLVKIESVIRGILGSPKKNLSSYCCAAASCNLLITIGFTNWILYNAQFLTFFIFFSVWSPQIVSTLKQEGNSIHLPFSNGQVASM